MTRRRPILKRLIIVAAAVGVATAVWFGGEALYRMRLRSLFDGPEVMRDAAPRRHGGLRYDLSDYLGPDVERDNETGRMPAVDAATGASQVYRAVVPTTYREVAAPDFLTIVEPVDGAVFPPNLCAPVVTWADPANDFWLVRLLGDDGRVLGEWLSAERRLRIPDAAWRAVVASRERTGRIEVLGIRRRGLWGKSSALAERTRVRFSVSVDPADEAVVYRLIDPPFRNSKTPDTYVRELRVREPRVLIRSHGRYCINCHTFSSPSAQEGTMAIQVRYLGRGDNTPNVYLSLCDLAKGGGRRTTLPFTVHMTTFMSWSPDGKRLAMCANQDLSSAEPSTLETQNTLQTDSDIAVLDLATWTTHLVPGASVPGVVETFPRWTPDGTRIVFCTGPARRPEPQTYFALRVVPAEGGTPQPLPHIPDDNAARVYPRFSPDGRWFTFVRTAGGALIKPSSDLCIMPADFSAAPRPLECNAPDAADSWYSWSSNSRWIVFTSKRDDGIFARLYLAHVDEKGHASPPVRLPIDDEPMMSFNIPEFVSRAPKISEDALFEPMRVETPPIAVPLVSGGTHD